MYSLCKCVSSYKSHTIVIAIDLLQFYNFHCSVMDDDDFAFLGGIEMAHAQPRGAQRGRRAGRRQGGFRPRPPQRDGHVVQQGD